MEAVSFRGAVKTYSAGAVRAVDGVDLTIGPGETVTLLGRNGAGKSTAIGLPAGAGRRTAAPRPRPARPGPAAPGAGTVAVLAGWLALFAGYAVYAYRRSAHGG